MSLRPLLLLLPLVAAIAMIALRGAGVLPSAAAPPHAEAAMEATRNGRLVIVIIDSLRRATLERDMPQLAARARAGVDVDVETCSANFTLPCVQTLLEGRESPFAAGIHNFTGTSGSPVSLPGIAARADLGTAMFSDHTLKALYASYGRVVLDVEEHALSHIARDHMAIDAALAALDDPRNDILIVHVVGTDKIAHSHAPSTAAYEAHYREVDAAFGELWARLDPLRDDVIVTGDHGHDEHGHHTRSSVAVMWGPQMSRLVASLSQRPTKLRQQDLLYFMAFSHLLPLPSSYEGSYFAHVAGDARVDRYADMLARSLAAAPGDTLIDKAGAMRRERKRAADRDALALVPLLAAMFAWLVLLGLGGSSRRERILLAGVCATAVASLWFSSPLFSVAAALLAIVASARMAERRARLRETTLLFALLAIGVVIAWFARDWAEWFHTRGGVTWRVVAFYVGLPLVGAALAWLGRRGVAGIPTAALAFGALCLPSGVYYYQFGQNLMWGFLLGGAAFVLWRAVVDRVVLVSRASALAAAVLVASGALLVMQESGGWRWKFFPTAWLEEAGTVPTGAMLALSVALMMHLCARRATRWALLSLISLALLFSCFVADLSLARLAASTLAMLLFTAWLRLSRDHVAANAELDGLLMMAAGAQIGWILLEGFFIPNIDFRFGFRFFGGLQRERDQAAFIFVATLFKYGFACAVPLVMYAFERGRQATERAATALFFWLALAHTMLLAQTLASSVAIEEKLYELAAMQLICMFLLLLMCIGAYLLVASIHRHGQQSGDGAATAIRNTPQR